MLVTPTSVQARPVASLTFPGMAPLAGRDATAGANQSAKGAAAWGLGQGTLWALMAGAGPSRGTPSYIWG